MTVRTLDPQKASLFRTSGKNAGPVRTFKGPEAKKEQKGKVVREILGNFLQGCKLILGKKAFAPVGELAEKAAPVQEMPPAQTQRRRPIWDRPDLTDPIRESSKHGVGIVNETAGGSRQNVHIDDISDRGVVFVQRVGPKGTTTIKDDDGDREEERPDEARVFNKGGKPGWKSLFGIFKRPKPQRSSPQAEHANDASIFSSEDPGEDVQVRKKSEWPKIIFALVMIAIGAVFFMTGAIEGKVDEWIGAFYIGTILIASPLTWNFVLWIIAIFEGKSRGQMLDVIAPIFTTASLILIKVFYGNTPWETTQGAFALGGATVGSLALMIAATFINPSERGQKKWWNQIDTTHWEVVGVSFILLYIAKSSWYPGFAPIYIPVIVAILGAAKEFIRDTFASLQAVGLGILAVLVASWFTTPQNTPWPAITAVLTGLVVSMVLAYLHRSQGWMDQNQTSHAGTIKFAGRNWDVVIAWDLVIFYIATTAILGYYLYPILQPIFHQ